MFTSYAHIRLCDRCNDKALQTKCEGRNKPKDSWYVRHCQRRAKFRVLVSDGSFEYFCGLHITRKRWNYEDLNGTGYVRAIEELRA